MESIRLAQGWVIGVANEPMDYAYFPVDAVISLVGTTLDGLSVEIGMVGRESYLGLPVVFGKPIHLYQSLVQHPGSAWRVPGAVLREALHESRSFRDHLLRHTHLRFLQLAQTSVCHRFHHLEQRLCRWLLSMQDRMNSNELHLTHERLAQLIGGRRPTVNTMTTELKRAGVIEYRRASLVIRDRKALERLSCECYRVIAQELAQSNRHKLSCS